MTNAEFKQVLEKRTVAFSVQVLKMLRRLPELNWADALCENDSRHYSCSQSQKILNERRGARRVLNTSDY